ncbi:SAM-dependent methyltransferase [Catenulispora sp. NL8]|uniref:SAM-dependent methyltransferase n=1 Tax=Catenulispora pinistramenti TaxID=2705254 RepID=A0ABS5KGI0_9ACTN|nr:SAM-dependent methyltransferase [Catenulispora pinistramenti]MBS2545288.1 SAM-dependent methyltransferase [Catenulispora pinistramenti]
MTEELGPSTGPLLPDWLPPEIDQTKAHPARMYDYMLGGKNHFEVDREAAEVAMRGNPAARAMVLENRAFLGRTVRHLAEAGITQYLDIGTGLPGAGNTGEVARAIQPEARVAYVDYDPIVAVHSRALLAGDEQHTTVVLADVREPKSILEHPQVRELLDFEQPVAVLMVALLHFVAEDEDAAGIAAAFRDVLVPGSALVISHGTDGGQPEVSAAARKGWDNAKSRITVREHEEIAALFGDFELVEPGLVQLPLWRPDGAVREDWETIWLDGGVGFKR